MRALLELVLTVIAIVIARAILNSFFRGVANAGRMSMNQQQQQQPPATGTSTGASQSTANPQPTGELHKDPVCGTYVAESTAYRRQMGGRTIYYCSEKCREREEPKAV
jgi:YHS domain-containing protein